MPIKKDDQFEIYFATNRRMDGSLDDPRFGERCHKDSPNFYRVGIATVEKRSNDLDEGYEVKKTVVKGEGAEIQNGEDGISEETSGEVTHFLKTSVRQYLMINAMRWFTFTGSQTHREFDLARRSAHEHYRIGHGSNAKHPIGVRILLAVERGSLSTLGILSDRSDAREAGPAMARALLRFSDYVRRNGNPCEQRIHLVAHSMGNWALRHAVQALATMNLGNRIEPIFDNALLMAADEDDDAFEKDHKLKPLLRLARRIHVYHSADDLSLVISNTTKFNPDRLGYDGPP